MNSATFHKKSKSDSQDFDYENFVNFSSQLHRTRDLASVVRLLQRKLTEIFDCTALRISFEEADHWNHLWICRGNSTGESTSKSKLLPHEIILRNENRPLCWRGKNLQPIADELSLADSKIDSIWGWNFQYSKMRQLTLTVVSGTEGQFGKKDILPLELFAEALETKLTEVRLQEQLTKQNRGLEQAYKTICEKTYEIEQILENQEKTIKSQTAQLAKRNEKLLEISMLNAHGVREPLSRIMGLVELMNISPTEELAYLVPLMRECTSEMDEALQAVIVEAAANVKLSQNSEK